jgi:hypothetical protein
MSLLLNQSVREEFRQQLVVTTKVNVIYVAGTIRSGSTLLGRLIALRDCGVHVGEIKELWLGIKLDHLCECRQPYLQCPFWSEVIRTAYGCIDKIDLDELIKTTRMVESIRLAPMHWFQTKNSALAQTISRYDDAVSRLYRSVMTISGCNTVVDSSKSPLYGNLLRQNHSIELTPVHLIRDSRAVAFSIQRKRLDPSKPAGELLPRVRVIRSAGGWVLAHSLLDAYPISDRQVTIRYEDLVTDPAKALESIPYVTNDDVTVVRPTICNKVEFPIGHSVMGNPMKFNNEIYIRPDNEWQTQMPQSSKLLVTALTLPALLRHGYPINP